MTEFKSWRSYWQFARAVRQQARYVFGPDVELFLNVLRETGTNRVEVLNGGSLLWRAQLGHDWEPIHQGGEYLDDGPVPHPPQRMKPLERRAVEGRANPKGIPYLYTSTDRDTALAEVRPWVGSLVSVAQFKVHRALRILNCTTADSERSLIYFEEPAAKERAKAVWRDVDEAFAEPVTRSDDVADYAPTQIIAELFKAEGLDGIAYRSALGPGHNVVLYDLGTAELINCSLFKLERISFAFAEAGNPYFTSKHHNRGDEGGT